MFDTLRALLRTHPVPRTEVPVDIAVAALLADAALADGTYDEVERRVVRDLLATMFELDAAAAQRLAEAGAAAQAEAVDVVRFTRVVKFALDEPARIELMQALWSVVLADQVRDPHEDALLRHLAPLLAVSDRDSVVARRRAAAATGG